MRLVWRSDVTALTSNTELYSMSTKGMGQRRCVVGWQGGAFRRQLQLTARDNAGQIAAPKQMQMNDKSGGEKYRGCETAGLR